MAENREEEDDIISKMEITANVNDNSTSERWILSQFS